MQIMTVRSDFLELQSAQAARTKVTELIWEYAGEHGLKEAGSYFSKAPRPLNNISPCKQPLADIQPHPAPRSIPLVVMESILDSLWDDLILCVDIRRFMSLILISKSFEFAVYDRRKSLMLAQAAYFKSVGAGYFYWTWDFIEDPLSNPSTRSQQSWLILW
ncbi:hypothetical protein DFJ77DRAFT_510207 [Powellomyces hirtus]|nr:hypothetical protein DFJ77DRAFT_510207 [Powellomyces hirtus]